MKGYSSFFCGKYIISIVGVCLVLSMGFCPVELYGQYSESNDEQDMIGLLPPKKIFSPLLADPRWPHFSASVQIFQSDQFLHNVGSANLGGAFPVVGWRCMGGVWQLGLQAGVFSIFDLDAPSDDLINSDFRVGLPLTFRFGHFSSQVRIYHQSSHLGDEFLLRNNPERINLSYEAIDLLISLDVSKAWRVYAGGGKLLSSSPNDLKKYNAHAGVELKSPYAMFGSFFPLVAGDFQSFEETGWDENYSLRFGFEIRNPRLANRKLQLLFEYFKGHSPNGQFFQRTIESYGGGLHFFF